MILLLMFAKITYSFFLINRQKTFFWLVDYIEVDWIHQSKNWYHKSAHFLKSWIFLKFWITFEIYRADFSNSVLKPTACEFGPLLGTFMENFVANQMAHTTFTDFMRNTFGAVCNGRMSQRGFIFRTQYWSKI
jgi:hypothetical protein